MLSTDGKLVYYLGIIDFLQQYDIGKKAEHFVKAYLLRKDKVIHVCYGDKTRMEFRPKIPLFIPKDLYELFTIYANKRFAKICLKHYL